MENLSLRSVHVDQSDIHSFFFVNGFSCTSENKLLLVVFVAFCVILFGSFFFVPDFSDYGKVCIYVFFWL
jgi:hypothetical protein